MTVILTTGPHGDCLPRHTCQWIHSPIHPHNFNAICIPELSELEVWTRKAEKKQAISGIWTGDLRTLGVQRYHLNQRHCTATTNRIVSQFTFTIPTCKSRKFMLCPQSTTFWDRNDFYGQHQVHIEPGNCGDRFSKKIPVWRSEPAQINFCIKGLVRARDIISSIPHSKLNTSWR